MKPKLRKKRVRSALVKRRRKPRPILIKRFDDELDDWMVGAGIAKDAKA